MARGQVDEPVWIDLESTIQIHDFAIEAFGGLGGVPNPHYLESALDAPRNTMLYSDGGLDLFDLAAVYLYHIAKAHAFTDGNKRTAYITAIAFLDVNGVKVLTPDNVLALAMAVEEAARDNTLAKPPLAALMRAMPVMGRVPDVPETDARIV